MLSQNSPVIFIIISLTISIAWAIILFFRYLRNRNKNISHIFSGTIVTLFMGIMGLILGIITDSEPLLIMVYALSLGFMGAVIYFIMELIEKLRKG